MIRNIWEDTVALWDDIMNAEPGEVVSLVAITLFICMVAVWADALPVICK